MGRASCLGKSFLLRLLGEVCLHVPFVDPGAEVAVHGILLDYACLNGADGMGHVKHCHSECIVFCLELIRFCQRFLRYRERILHTAFAGGVTRRQNRILGRILHLGGSIRNGVIQRPADT